MRLFCRLFFADSLLLVNGLNLIQFRLNGCLFFLDIVIVLQSQPESRRCPEVLPESQCRICGDATTSSDYFRYSCLRYPGLFRETVRTNAHGLQELVFQDVARMHVVESVAHILTSSVIIGQFYIVRIAVGPGKADSPLVVHPDTHLSDAIAFQLFKSIVRRHTQFL